MKLRVEENISKGLARGLDTNGRFYLIENGDLFLGKEIEVDLINDRFTRLPQFNYEIEELIKEFGDRDDLIYSKDLKEIELSKDLDRIFKIGNYWVCPDKNIYNEVEILLRQKELWSQSRIRISNKSRQKVSSRLPVFGIDFKRAIEKVAESGKEISHFYCPDRKKFQNPGSFADFLVILNSTKRGITEFQCWQAIEKEVFLMYAHAEIDLRKGLFVHFDCAKHRTNIEEIKVLFCKHSRIKISEKKKYFRLDGEIMYNQGFDLMKQFFPLDNLIDEYYIKT